MSTLLEEPRTQESVSPSQRLRTTMAAARVSFTWLGVRKSLTAEQRCQAADSFGAAGNFLSAGKKLLDTKHPAYKAVTSVRSRTVSYWRGVSLPFPEPGIRLIRQEAITEFDNQITTFRQDLNEAVADLDRQYDGLRSAAQERLGELFDSRDYPPSLVGLFAIEHDFPSVEPPAYLQQLSPELYQQECQRIQARFEEAVQLAESAFTEELQRLVGHLTERLTGEADGRPKVFRDSAVQNLSEFFERFRRLNIRSNEQLDQLVDQCQQIVQGVEPQSLRDSQVLRQSVAQELGEVQSVLDNLLVDRPRRNILRRPR